MKTKKFEKVIILKKQTISNLYEIEMDEAKGGSPSQSLYYCYLSIPVSKCYEVCD